MRHFPARPERVLVLPGTYDGRNFGDAAALRIGLRRIRECWPGVRIGLLTDSPEAMGVFEPDAELVPVQGLRARMGGLGIWREPAAGRSLGSITRSICRWIGFSETASDAVARSAGKLIGAGGFGWRDFVRRFETFDLLVVSGTVGLSDRFPVHTRLVLELLELAMRRKVPFALSSQALGPLQEIAVRRRAQRVLAGAALIGIREKATTAAFLESLEVPASRIRVTGDDAVELSVQARAVAAGAGLGVNVRVASYSGFDESLTAWLGPVLQTFLRDHEAPLVALPIAFHGVADDAARLRSLFSRCGVSPADAPLDLHELLARIGTCRLIVTGAYHAAVFALAQGVPALCLSSSDFYSEKFQGLAQAFGGGCEVLRVQGASDTAAVAARLNAMWRDAGRWRDQLRAVAETQVTLSRSAWKELAMSLERVSRPLGHPARGGDAEMGVVG